MVGYFESIAFLDENDIEGGCFLLFHLCTISLDFNKIIKS